MSYVWCAHACIVTIIFLLHVNVGTTSGTSSSPTANKSLKTCCLWWNIFVCAFIFVLVTAMVATQVPIMVYTGVSSDNSDQCTILNVHNMQHEPTHPREDDSSAVNSKSTAVAVDSDNSSATKTTWGRNFGLPNIRHALIGREQEMEELTRYLRDEAVEVVTLYSGPGYGKTIMSRHIGHREIEAGTDVYYITVNVLPNVERLVEKLIEVSELEIDDRKSNKLENWAKLINKKSLLILDDIYGPSWLHETALADFQNNFTSVLLQYSRKLKILITSQLEIQPPDCEFRSVNLESPSLPTCVTMFSRFVNMSSDTTYYVSDSPCTVENRGCLERDKVETVCTRVGKVPKVLQTLATRLSRSNDITIDRLIKMINVNALKYAAKHGGKTHLSAYEATFDYIEHEYQICCILLTRFPGFFTVTSTESIITRDLMVKYNKSFQDFDVSDCLTELDGIKFIETTTYYNSEMEADHHIHNLTRDYLTTTDKVSVPTEVLKAFWDAYFEQIKDTKADPWLREDLSNEDISITLDFLSRREHNSYRLARHVTSYISVNMGGAVECLRDEAVYMLVADCKNFSLTYPPASVPVIIKSYINIFSNVYAGVNGQDIMDKLAMCEAKVEQLNSLVKMSTVAYFAVHFRGLITSRYKDIQNAHRLCSGGFNSWRYNMFDFVTG